MLWVIWIASIGWRWITRIRSIISSSLITIFLSLRWVYFNFWGVFPGRAAICRTFSPSTFLFAFWWWLWHKIFRRFPSFCWRIPILLLASFITKTPRILLILINNCDLILSYILIVHTLWSLTTDLLHKFSG